MKRIPLTQGQFAIVDDEDFEWLNQYKWHIHKGGNTFYAVRKLKNRTVSMHRVIMDVLPGEHIDHRNHKGFDNRKTNMRICSAAQNQWNQRKNHLGIFESKYQNKWCASISHNGKRIYLGIDNTKNFRPNE